MGFEMLDLRSWIDVFPFPVGVPGLGFVDPASSNLLLVGLDNANTAFSSSSSTSIYTARVPTPTPRSDVIPGPVP